MGIDIWKDRMISTNQFPFFNYDTFENGPKTHPFAMLCMLIDDDLMIAVGCDPLSPFDFRAKYPNSVFKIDFSIPPRTTDTIHGRRTIYYAKNID
jgi:hypothetical protein